MQERAFGRTGRTVSELGVGMWGMGGGIGGWTGADDHWPGVGYEFRLPPATAYRSIRVEVMGTWTGRQPTIGFHDWPLGLAWGQLYQPDWRSTAISPTATRWAGVTTTDTAHFVSGRTARVYIEGGGRLAGTFAFVVTGVRLLVSVGTAQ